MNYIILNNENSKDIAGLLIQELPPIIKPEIRTLIEEIDGKDGDIIEELGYKAYDKAITIALTKNYDIDKVIHFFDSKGIVVFSNEPTKYYHYSIIGQIDFTRLLRYKVATINFHVQPFKYLINESNIDVTIIDQTEIIVNNQGFITSKPTITLYGDGIVEISLNGSSAFQINIDSDYVTIDSEQQDAHKDSILKNRMMIGDFPILQAGENVITWSGNLTRIMIEPKSRWI